MIQLLPHGQGHPVVLEEPALVKTGVSQVLPEGSLDSRRSRLMRRWRRSSASCSSTSRFQYFQESGQVIAVASRGETGHRLGAHGGQLELAAQLTDAFLHDDGVHHPHTPAAGIPSPEREYRFHPPRRCRFDFAWPAQKVAVEMEGVTHYGAGIGRHQSAQGFVADCEKYETALIDGWRVYRVPGPWIREGKETVWRPQVMETLHRLLVS